MRRRDSEWRGTLGPSDRTLAGFLPLSASGGNPASTDREGDDKKRSRELRRNLDCCDAISLDAARAIPPPEWSAPSANTALVEPSRPWLPVRNQSKSH